MVFDKFFLRQMYLLLYTNQQEIQQLKMYFRWNDICM